MQHLYTLTFSGSQLYGTTVSLHPTFESALRALRKEIQVQVNEYGRKSRGILGKLRTLIATKDEEKLTEAYDLAVAWMRDAMGETADIEAHTLGDGFVIMTREERDAISSVCDFAQNEYNNSAYWADDMVEDDHGKARADEMREEIEEALDTVWGLLSSTSLPTEEQEVA
jgi:hypothetical protein